MPGIRVQSYAFGAHGAPDGEDLTVVSQIGTDGDYLPPPAAPASIFDSVTVHKIVKVLAIGCSIYVAKFGTDSGLATFDQIGPANSDFIPEGGSTCFHLKPGQGLTALTAAIS